MANRQSLSEPVYCARSLDEVRLIEALHEMKGPKYILARGFISVWRVFANAAIATCRYLMFGCSRRPKQPWRNIVCYTVGTLGDNVVLVPAYAALKQAFPESSLTVITYAGGDNAHFARELLSACPWVDRVVPLSEAPVTREGFKLRLTCGDAAKVDCDLFVNLSPYCNTGWLGAVARELLFAKRLHARRAVGFRLNSYSRRGRILDKVKHHFVQNEPRRATAVLKELGLVPQSSPSLFAASHAGRQEITRMLGALGAGRPLFVLNPGAKFAIKCWPSERFAELASQLVRHYGAAIVVTGLPTERPLGDAVIARVPRRGVNLCGLTSVVELLELLRLSTACVTNDTGTMHLAAALGVPTVALFTTRISPSHWFPVGPRVMALFSFGDESYSYKDEGEAPCGCLLHIGVADVMNAVRECLQPSEELTSARAVAPSSAV